MILDLYTLTRFLKQSDARCKALRELAETPTRSKAKRSHARAQADRSAAEYESARQDFVALLQRWSAAPVPCPPDLRKDIDSVCSGAKFPDLQQPTEQKS